MLKPRPSVAATAVSLRAMRIRSTASLPLKVAPVAGRTRPALFLSGQDQRCVGSKHLRMTAGEHCEMPAAVAFQLGLRLRRSACGLREKFLYLLRNITDHQDFGQGDSVWFHTDADVSRRGSANTCDDVRP